MSPPTAAIFDPPPASGSSSEIVLLDLIGALIDAGANDRQVALAVMDLLETGRVTPRRRLAEVPDVHRVRPADDVAVTVAIDEDDPWLPISHSPERR